MRKRLFEWIGAFALLLMLGIGGGCQKRVEKGTFEDFDLAGTTWRGVYHQYDENTLGYRELQVAVTFYPPSNKETETAFGAYNILEGEPRDPSSRSETFRYKRNKRYFNGSNFVNKIQLFYADWIIFTYTEDKITMKQDPEMGDKSDYTTLYRVWQP